MYYEVRLFYDGFPFGSGVNSKLARVSLLIN